MAARYRRQRAFEPLQRLLTAAPQLAIWDDHDYGPNDSDTSYVLKGETLKLFQRYWPNPSYGLPDVPGTFGFAQYGDVDCSSCSTIATTARPTAGPTAPTRRCSAPRQLEWLKQALISAPRNSIKIIAGGSQFWNRASRFEGWHHFRDRAAGLRRVARAAADRRRDLPVRRPPLRRAPAHRAARRLSAARVHVEPAHLAAAGPARPGRAREPGSRARDAPQPAAVRPDPVQRTGRPARHHARGATTARERSCGRTRSRRPSCASRAQGRTSLEPERPCRGRDHGAGAY